MKNGMSVLLLLVLAAGTVGAQSITISGVDNSSLLVNQKVGVYLSVTDDAGTPVLGLTEDDFAVFETSRWMGEQEREIVDFQQGINATQGITMLLLVDNSGSMYYNADGSIQDSPEESIWRITAAKEAVISLLRDIENPADRVGFASFNHKIGTVVSPTDDPTEVEAAVRAIEKPGEGQGFTELYEALYESLETVRNAPGRKVVVLLSDGENYPKEGNPAYPERQGLDGALDFALQEGVSVFTIGLSSGADWEELQRIASTTGGAFFSAYDPTRLAQLYGQIRHQVLNEYWMTFRAGMEPSELKSVRVVFQGGTGAAEREYYAATMFGIPPDPFIWLILLAIPLAVLLLWLLSKLKFEKNETLPSLQLLDVGGKRTHQSMTIVEGKNQITIGGADASDLTIAGDPGLDRVAATIVQQDGVFTVSGGGVKVNNQTVRNRKLRSGDVITVGNSTVVFDAGMAATVAAGKPPVRPKAAQSKQAPGRQAPARKSTGKAPKKR